MRPPRVALLAYEVGRARGQGHASRMLALAEAFRSLRWQVYLAPYVAAGDALADAPTTPPLPDLLRRYGPSVLVMDGLQAPPWADLVGPMVAVTADAADPPHAVDVVLDGRPGAEARPAVGRRRDCYGAQYALLREDVGEVRRMSVAEPAQPYLCQVAEIAGLPHRQLLEHLRAATLAVCPAGVRYLECLCLGVPTVLFARNAGERRAIELLQATAERRVALSDPAMVRPLASNPRLRAALRERGRHAVDGLGALRVARVLERLASPARSSRRC